MFKCNENVLPFVWVLSQFLLLNIIFLVQSNNMGYFFVHRSCDAMATAAAVASSPTTTTTTTTSIEQTRSTTHEKHTTTIRTTEEQATTSSANNETAEATSSISTTGETSRFANTGRQHTTDSNDDDEPRLWNHRMKSSSTYSSLAAKPRTK